MQKQRLSRALKLFGTNELPGKTRTLSAGPVSVVLDNGSIRYIRYQGVEVLRGIAYLLRDKNWGTTAPTIERLKVNQARDGFKVSYTAKCQDASQVLRYDAEIEASANGVVSFKVNATPITNVLTNRTGFVVLHPLTGVVGQPIEIIHTDGTKEKTRFPKLISPGQPVLEIRSIKHTVVPGVTATVLMEGNKFEMEDHRNWMDASYKTYVCSLLDPWPYELKQGQSFAQSITVTIQGKSKTKAIRSSKAITVAVGAVKGRVPAVGVGIPMAEAEASLLSVDLLAAAKPAHLVCQLDGRIGDVKQAVLAFQELKARTGKPVMLEIVLPAEAPAMAEMAEIANMVEAGRLVPDAIIVTHTHDLKSFQPNTPRPWGPSYEEMASAARKHFATVPLGGGMLSFFTELNRKPVPKGLFDFVTHTVCPIVHTADDASVMETLESMPSIIASTRNMIGSTPYYLGPSSIACRDNPYGAAVFDNPDGRRICLSDNDPRQRGVFAAAWNLGLVAAAARGGINVVTLGSFTGKQGVVGDDGLLPMYHAMAGLAGASQARRLDAVSSRPATLETLAYQTKAGKSLWLANLSGEEQNVKFNSFSETARLNVVDASNFGKLQSNPGYMNTSGKLLSRVRELNIGPYSVVRLDTTPL